jgi:hypothetical protein
MNTALFLAVVLSAATGVSPTTPTWNGSYVQAQDEAAGKKPLAVVFGSGQDGWTKLVRSEEAKKVLAEQYVCVYVDVTTDAGKKLAQSFAINGDKGLVLSDRSGHVQAFWHQGDLADTSLTRSLWKYADPTVAVVSTEQESTTRVSNYPTTGLTTTGTVINGSVYAPVRSSCPNGNCPYAR